MIKFSATSAPMKRSNNCANAWHAACRFSGHAGAAKGVLRLEPIHQSIEVFNV